MKILLRILLWGVVAAGTYPLLLALLSPQGSWRDAAAFAAWLLIAVFGYRFVMRLPDELARWVCVLAMIAVAMTGTLLFLKWQLDSGRWPVPRTAMIATSVSCLASSLGGLIVLRNRRKGARS